MEEIPEYNGLVTRRALDGDKVQIVDILNTPIVICAFQITASKYKDRGSGKCVKVQFYFASDEAKTCKVFFSGSGILCDELEEAKKSLEAKEMPLLFRATVKKVGNYYSLT